MSISTIQVRDQVADMVILSGAIYTMDTKNSRAEAIAITDGKISAVGSSTDIRQMVGSRTKIIEIEEKTVCVNGEAIARPKSSKPLIYTR